MTSLTYSTKLLVVDDDAEIRTLLGEFLNQHGFDVELAKDGLQMFAQLAQHSFDAIILDVMLPGDNGLTLCKKIRSTSDIPIIMLTAVSEDIDRIVGLEIGADDYLPKPFNPRELLARIRAILRRRSSNENNTTEKNKTPCHTVYHFKQWRLNKTNRQLFSNDDAEISISASEFDLLLTLLEHPQHVLSRDQLLDLTKNRVAGPFDRSIDIQISRLRRKLEEDPKNSSLIKTVRGGGYILACSVLKRKTPIPL